MHLVLVILLLFVMNFSHVSEMHLVLAMYAYCRFSNISPFLHDFYDVSEALLILVMYVCCPFSNPAPFYHQFVWCMHVVHLVIMLLFVMNLCDVNMGTCNALSGELDLVVKVSCELDTRSNIRAIIEDV